MDIKEIESALPLDGVRTPDFDEYFDELRDETDSKTKRALLADAKAHVPIVAMRAQYNPLVRKLATEFLDQVLGPSFKHVVKNFPKLVPLVEQNLAVPFKPNIGAAASASLIKPNDAAIMEELHARHVRGASLISWMPMKSGPVLVVRRRGARASHHVLMGIYRPLVFNVSDVELVSVVVGRRKFVLQRGSVYLGRAEGVTPIACTCGDWVHRSRYAAVLGCKHMIAIHTSCASA
ncbi:MAG: hypothetical protein VW104_08120 [Halieaceae bacterium]